MNFDSKTAYALCMGLANCCKLQAQLHSAVGVILDAGLVPGDNGAIASMAISDSDTVLQGLLLLAGRLESAANQLCLEYAGVQRMRDELERASTRNVSRETSKGQE